MTATADRCPVCGSDEPEPIHAVLGHRPGLPVLVLGVGSEPVPGRLMPDDSIVLDRPAGDDAPRVVRFLGIQPGEWGQGLAEYALILALVAVVAIIALVFLGSEVSSTLSRVGSAV